MSKEKGLESSIQMRGLALNINDKSSSIVTGEKADRYRLRCFSSLVKNFLAAR